MTMTMNNITLLKEIFSSYPECISNHKLFNALLLDYFYEDKIIQNIYKFISIEGILSDISKKNVVSDVDIERYCLIILNNYGIEKTRAKPYIVDIVQALNKGDITVEKKTKDKHIKGKIKKDYVENESKLEIGENANITLVGSYLGIGSEAKMGVLECGKDYYYVLPTVKNKKIDFKQGEKVYFLAESVENMKFATIVSKLDDVSNHKFYPLLNKKWEGKIKKYDERALMGTILCEQLGEEFEMFVDRKVIKQNLKIGEKVAFFIHINRNILIATDVER